MKDSVGETPTGATSSFAKASEDRGTVALPRKVPNDRGGSFAMIDNRRREAGGMLAGGFAGIHPAPRAIQAADFPVFDMVAPNRAV